MRDCKRWARCFAINFVACSPALGQIVSFHPPQYHWNTNIRFHSASLQLRYILSSVSKLAVMAEVDHEVKIVADEQVNTFVVILASITFELTEFVVSGRWSIRRCKYRFLKHQHQRLNLGLPVRKWADVPPLQRQE